MNTVSTPTTQQYKQVVVDVPEDRVAEFHAFFARFLAGPTGRGRRGRHGRPHRGLRGRRCAERRGAPEQEQAARQPDEVTEV
jgi:hypothetical protein